MDREMNGCVKQEYDEYRQIITKCIKTAESILSCYGITFLPDLIPLPSDELMIKSEQKNTRTIFVTDARISYPIKRRYQIKNKYNHDIIFYILDSVCICVDCAVIDVRCDEPMMTIFSTLSVHFFNSSAAFLVPEPFKEMARGGLMFHLNNILDIGGQYLHSTMICKFHEDCDTVEELSKYIKTKNVITCKAKKRALMFVGCYLGGHSSILTIPHIINIISTLSWL